MACHQCTVWGELTFVHISGKVIKRTLCRIRSGTEDQSTLVWVNELGTAVNPLLQSPWKPRKLNKVLT